MKITPAQLEQFCATIQRGSSVQGRSKVLAGLEGLGITVERTPLDRMAHRGHQLISGGRAQELRAALRLLNRARVSECTEDEAGRLLEYFGGPEDEF